MVLGFSIEIFMPIRFGYCADMYVFKVFPVPPEGWAMWLSERSESVGGSSRGQRRHDSPTLRKPCVPKGKRSESQASARGASRPKGDRRECAAAIR